MHDLKGWGAIGMAPHGAPRCLVYKHIIPWLWQNVGNWTIGLAFLSL